MQKVINQWSVGPEVNKSNLGKEIRDFCGNFSVYRLEPFSLDSVSIGMTERSKRVTRWPLCDMHNSNSKCNPDNWRLNCKVMQFGDTCVYYLYGCPLDFGSRNFDCKFRHQYDSIVCCDPVCSTG